jgi:hypothetical protein
MYFASKLFLITDASVLKSHKSQGQAINASSGRVKCMKIVKPISVVFIIAMVLSIQVQAQSFLTNGLVAYYPLNGNADDFSGNGNNGIVNGATLTIDRFGNQNSAYLFSPSSSIVSYTNIGITGNSNRTISLWINILQSPTFPDGLLIFFGDQSSVGSSFGLRYSGFVGQYQDGLFDMNAFYTEEYAQYYNFNTNQWFQVVLTYGGSMAGLQYYFNGNLATNNPDIGYHYTDTLNTTPTDLYIGSNGLTEGFTGAINNVRIYNRVLSSNEVAQLYAYESTPPNSSFTNGLVIGLIKSVRPSFSNLNVGVNYQLQVSTDLNTWTNQGSVFSATNSSMVFPQYFDVADRNNLFFRLQVSP